jgi:hypothetical protein
MQRRPMTNHAKIAPASALPPAPEEVIQCCERSCEAIVELWFAVGSFVHLGNFDFQRCWGTE